ncbi:mRNA cleavage and polyadenylation factor IA/II complex [Lindgomyces ingoldianus]|uniref:mRNA cleavage and polyadenylation factor IA/II complex n=1 Tax=Lindgomyces ingoldianus TaxID=673940 RepID=A0ACB6R679_9PLEO|nr:mRNA cleavage and polyadenylation factor IA/II complex [Lindgomyces ingoldianus]KAF2473812.1 mRNA cleavage and polyadenylation factor IA/II complex [Lindgomyces ingoldianus]
MISLPGLHLSNPTPEPPSTAESIVTRTQDLLACSEYRFEVPFTRTLTIRLLTGTAEFFGTELAPSSTYTFTGTKGAVYTWRGCKLEIGGLAESEYTSEETQMMSYANAHFALEKLRERSVQTGELGPRILVVGPENAGKTSVVKILTSYAVKAGRQPVVVNLDPRQGMLSVPGSVTAAAFSSIIDIEDSWGSSPISGPSPVPVKMPLVYHYGIANPDEGSLFRPLVTRMALAVTSRLEDDKPSRQAGFIIDTSGAISHGKGGVYENIDHIISEFSVNVLFVLGSERLYSDLARKYSNRPTEEAVSVVRLDKSGGCVDRDEAYMKQLRQAQIRAYFFGHGENTLGPHSHMADYDELNIFRIVDAASDANSSFRPGNDDDDVYGSTNNIYTKATPSPMIQNSLLAVTTAAATDSQEVIRDSSVRGYIYVADVDDVKKKVRLLSPQPGQTPSNAIILGSFPEDVPGLVS